MAWTDIPTRTGSNYNVPADVNQLQENIRLLKGGVPATAPASTVKDLNDLMVDTRTNWIPRSERGVVGGVAPVGLDGLIPSAYIPPVAISEWLGEFVDIPTALADPGVAGSQRGDWLSITGTGSYIVIVDSPTVAGDLKAIIYPSAPVSSVNGQTGAVSIDLDNLPENVTFRKFRYKYTTTDPTATDDVSADFREGDFWQNSTTQKVFTCRDSTIGNAVWVRIQFDDEKGQADGYGSLDGAGRQPLAEVGYHATNHSAGGVDPIAPSDIGALDATISLQNDDSAQLEAGMVVYLSASGKVKRANSGTYAESKIIGFVKSTIAIGATGEIATGGVIDIPDWSLAIDGYSGPMTQGNIYYISDASEYGKIRTEYEENPGADNFSVRVGIAISSTKMMINVTDPIKMGWGLESSYNEGSDLKPLIMKRQKIRRLSEGENLSLEGVQFTKPGTAPYLELLARAISRDSVPSGGSWDPGDSGNICFAVNIESRGIWVQTFSGSQKWDKVATDRSRKRHFLFMGA